MLRLPQLSLILCACTTATALLAQTVPPVYFNHLTIYVPPAEYTAFIESSFLQNEFSGSQEQTVQRDGGTWSYTGVFLHGQHTYFELFKAGLQEGRSGTPTTPPGLIVFNMWLDDRQQLPLFRNRLVEARGVPLEIVTAHDAKNRPAYDSVSRQGRLTPLPGILGYTVLKGYYPDGSTREQRFADRYHPERYLHDITGFTLTVSEAERDALVQDFRAYGYPIRADGERRIASGPEIVFTLIPVKGGEPRTLAVDLSMNRTTTGAKSFKFAGTSEMRVEGRTAKWIFAFPEH